MPHLKGQGETGEPFSFRLPPQGFLGTASGTAGTEREALDTLFSGQDLVQEINSAVPK
jgi:hypothetical protein